MNTGDIDVMTIRPEEEETEDVETRCEECMPGGEVRRWKSGEDEGRAVKKLGDPRKPTQMEVEDHERTHLPYRNWCAYCVMGKGKDLDHRKAIEGERGLSEYSFDYCFPGDEFGFKLTVLVGREHGTGMTMGTVVPAKGSSGRFAAEKIIEFMEECGDGAMDVIVKSDQEPAIGVLIKDLVEIRGDTQARRTIVEESPVGSSGSNGKVERAAQGIEGQIRVMKLALEGRLKRQVDTERRIVTFMAEYAGYLLNRLEVGKDGKTAYERSRGKKASVLGLEFGEKCLWKKRPKEKMEKINTRWEFGIFVGIRRRGGEVWMATQEGIVKVRSVRRLSMEET